ncbi:putative P450 monooxygenase [Bisporella sp. PMI_857]|nr:putative P450 monooxygenase [Bisporella sp. PMI_857]
MLPSNVPLQLFVAIFSAWLLQRVIAGIFNLFYHPLAAFPGPRGAAITAWYKTYQEVLLGRSWINVLSELHGKHGKVVRVGPNELHFSSPAAYHEIYNNSNRWDKEAGLYRSFGEDRSSFGFLTYAESKQRKDIMAPLFSRRAIFELQDLVQSNVDRLCEVLKSNNVAGKSSDLFFGLRCFTMDTITSFCFAKSVNALAEPDFKAPIIEAMEASLPAFVLFKHFSIIRKAVFGMPPWLSIIVSPQTAGLIHLQRVLGAQVTDVVKNPDSLQGAPHRIIYHELLSPEAAKGAELPSAGSLYEEAQALMFGGADTIGNTLMLGAFYLLESPGLAARLKEELSRAWPVLDTPPRFEDLEKLPFLTAVIKESLRISPGVASPLLRVVPAAGATISGSYIPPNSIVGMSGSFVHSSEEIFKNPNDFNPDRWLEPNSASLERWLVAFSKGPRMCMGQNLAYCELYLVFAGLFRRFDLGLDGTTVADLTWRECFLPHFQGRHLQAFCRPVTT